MGKEKTESPVAHLFRAPMTTLWLPAFAAGAIGDPVAAKALGPYIGPASMAIEGGGRARVPGDVHFARTWAVIKPGFCGTAPKTYSAHTRTEHRRTRIPAELIALPIQWVQVMTSTVAEKYGREGLLGPIAAAGLRFAQDIEGATEVVRMPLPRARLNMAKHFRGVEIAPEQAIAFWGAMQHPVVARDLWGAANRMDVARVRNTLQAHLPAPLVAQYMKHRPI